MMKENTVASEDRAIEKNSMEIDATEFDIMKDEEDTIEDRAIENDGEEIAAETEDFFTFEVLG